LELLGRAAASFSSEDNVKRFVDRWTVIAFVAVILGICVFKLIGRLF